MNFLSLIHMKKINKKLIIYQAKNGAIAFRGDFLRDTIWANLNQIADLFGVQKAAISKHLKNIYNEKELDKKATVSILETVQREGDREVVRKITYYNLDVIISVGYRVNSKTATTFRIWATKTLKHHLTKGYTINKKMLRKNHAEFLRAVEDIKLLAGKNEKVFKDDVLELITAFSSTWFNLESYDKQSFPKKGQSQRKVKIEFEKFAQDLYEEIALLKCELIAKKEATELFAQEKQTGSLQGILGNVFQSVFSKEVYQSTEEKAGHLLYFIIKNHPFNDGNKRTGAFSFIWFLRKMNFDFTYRITPASLTTLTLLIAESNPKDKEKMIGLVLLLLKK